MYWPKPGIKRDPVRRWNRPNRIFFGFGACHILAGAYLRQFPGTAFRPERIIPDDGFAGNHIYLTDGRLSFDFHGYSLRDQLLAHHERGWSSRYPGWVARIEAVDFDLLDTAELNARKMLGPNQYLGDALVRAIDFIARIDRAEGIRRAISRVPPLTSG